MPRPVAVRLVFPILPIVALLVGADAPPKGYVASRATTPIKVDGKLDDEAWADAPWTDAFVDIEGDTKPKPRFRTRAKMLWDDTYFYVAAEMEEPHVWGTLTKHDSVIFQDNDFEVFIDPDGDNHEYLRDRGQRPEHRVGPVPGQALSRRRPGRQRAGRSPG